MLLKFLVYFLKKSNRCNQSSIRARRHYFNWLTVIVFVGSKIRHKYVAEHSLITKIHKILNYLMITNEIAYLPIPTSSGVKYLYRMSLNKFHIERYRSKCY